MNVSEYCESLIARVSAEEREQLLGTGSDLMINAHNKATMAEMLQSPQLAGDAQQAVDLEAAGRLERELGDYLDEYMAESPEAHKWIVLASLYLTYVARRPMHPIDRVGIVVRERGGETFYGCPAQTDSFICRHCACEPLKNLYWMVDILPEQVPAGQGGSYFAVERYLREGACATELYEKFARMLLKLNCYYDLEIERDGAQVARNPQPAALVELVSECAQAKGARPLSVRFGEGAAELLLTGDDLNMTLFGPSNGVLELVEDLARAEGLFVWGPQVWDRG